MTICIGMRARDGLVMAADAQESDTYYKRSQQKIFPWLGAVAAGEPPPPPQMACLFTGAGDAGYIDAFIDESMKGITHDMKDSVLEEHLRQSILSFHERHLFPLATTQNRPEIEMVIGTYCQFQTRLYVSHGSTLRTALSHCAVGIGAHYALGIMQDFFDVSSIRETELIAAYVIAATKESIDGCGKYTAIYSLHGPTIVEGTEGSPSRLAPARMPMTYVPGRTIDRWEKAFAEKWSPRQRHLMAELLEEELKADSMPSGAQTLEGQP
ncbi:MAG: hypothetical protein WB622_07305 [Acidobacteriaceae bacterium]